VRASEIKARLLTDHAQLRGKATVLESLALQILRGDDELASALRLKGEDLQANLLAHMRWEEAELLPLLARSGVEGYTSADFLEEHQSQREALAESLLALRDSNLPATALAKNMIDFVRWLERDMITEEGNVLPSIEASAKTQATAG